MIRVILLLLLFLLFSALATAAVTIVGSVQTASCTNGAFTCAITYTPTNVGDTIVAYTTNCYDGSCAAPITTTMSPSDTKNTFAERACGHISTNSSPVWDIHEFVAANVTSGLAVLTFTTTQSFFYGTIYLLELTGVPTSSVTDSNVCKSQQGSGAGTFTMTSTGHPAKAGEMMLGVVSPNNGVTVTMTGSFSFLSAPVVSFANPSTGSNVSMTANVSGSTQQYWATMDGFVPAASTFVANQSAIAIQ